MDSGDSPHICRLTLYSLQHANVLRSTAADGNPENRTSFQRQLHSCAGNTRAQVNAYGTVARFDHSMMSRRSRRRGVACTGVDSRYDRNVVPDSQCRQRQDVASRIILLRSPD
jgi:hypothetical protein